MMVTGVGEDEQACVDLLSRSTCQLQSEKSAGFGEGSDFQVLLADRPRHSDNASWPVNWFFRWRIHGKAVRHWEKQNVNVQVVAFVKMAS